MVKEHVRKEWIKGGDGQPKILIIQATRKGTETPLLTPNEIRTTMIPEQVLQESERTLRYAHKHGTLHLTSRPRSKDWLN